jgi:PleD family two-component response regulator
MLAPTRPDTGSPAIILLVHHSPVTWLGELLMAQGHQVAHVVTAAEAQQRLLEEDPDLIVVTEEVPDDAATLICRALHDVTGGDRPIVIESGGDLTPARRAEFLRAGAWDFISPTLTPADNEGLLRLGHLLQARRVAARERLGILTDPRTGLYNRIGLSRRARELGAQTFRTHDSVGCVVFGLKVEPDTEAAMAYCARAVHDEGRLSDVVARLGDREIAILAPRTDEAGALRLAERIARALKGHLTRPEGEGIQLELRATYDAVASLGYVPIQPIDLVIQAAATLRARIAREEESTDAPWIRRSGGQPRVTTPPN